MKAFRGSASNRERQNALQKKYVFRPIDVPFAVARSRVIPQIGSLTVTSFSANIPMMIPPVHQG
jgi:hypothetical protein